MGVDGHGDTTRARRGQAQQEQVVAVGAVDDDPVARVDLALDARGHPRHPVRGARERQLQAGAGLLDERTVAVHAAQALEQVAEHRVATDRQPRPLEDPGARSRHAGHATREPPRHDERGARVEPAPAR